MRYCYGNEQSFGSPVKIFKPHMIFNKSQRLERVCNQKVLFLIKFPEIGPVSTWKN